MPNNKYMNGIKCSNWDCRCPSLYCATLYADRVSQQVFSFVIIGNTRKTKKFFILGNQALLNHMENPWFVLSSSNELNCGSLQVQSIILRGARSMFKKSLRSKKFVGGAIPSTSCPKAMIMRRAKFRGAGCAEISLGCSKPAAGFQLYFHLIRSSLRFGLWLHGLSGTCRGGYYVFKFHCQHDFCAEMVLKNVLLRII